MTPALHPDRIVFAFTFFKSLKPGHIIIFNHHGTEKIKRIGKVKEGLVYVKGDNPNLSTDSRHFGWIGVDSIVARVVWPGVKQKNMI